MPDLIDTARQALKSKKQNYGSVSKKGVTHPGGHKSCHAPLNATDPVWFLHLGGVGCSGVDGSAVLPSITTEAGIAWITWFLGKNSPWAPMVHELNQDVDFAIQYGIVLQPERDRVNYGYNAVIASRFPTEFHGCCDKWYELVQKGVHPNVALVAITATLEKHFGHPWTNGHGAIVDCFTLSCARFDNFSRGVPNAKNFSVYRTPASTIWDSDKSTGPWNVRAAGMYPEAFGEKTRLPMWGGAMTPCFKLETHWEILLKEQQRLGLENTAS